MARPTPKDNARRAMVGWLTDKSIDKWTPATETTETDLQVEVQSLIAYRNSESEEGQALIAGGLAGVRWDLLSDAAKGPTVWAALARKMGPQALRMNLNTLLRHDVFDQPEGASLRFSQNSAQQPDASAFRLLETQASSNTIVDYVAGRIADESEIRASKQFTLQHCPTGTVY